MHAMNVAFWKRCKELYPAYFNRPQIKVLEMGSRNVGRDHGMCIRQLFPENCHYVGVDWVDGDNVDVIGLAHEVRLDAVFDVVVSASMLEHDPYWSKSIANMARHLHQNGILLLSWGAALNPSHCSGTAPDGKFHALPAGKVLRLLGRLGVHVHEFWYEANLFPAMAEQARSANAGLTGVGEVVLVGFKNPQRAIGPAHIDELFPEDCKGE